MTSGGFEERGSAVLRAGGSGVAWNESGGEIVVLDLDTSVYFGLNSSGAALWKRLTAGASRKDLVIAVMAWGVDGATATADVDDFLTALDRCALLRPG